ncbi:amidase signature enzyme [Laetiporus sulphureus 93-53]|uniref:Amidase signature enzyme n=1 Tax=Laetiporus sulphureus 93-53 TaxID=1314785 RepID=A0A165DJF3_9APHY|nr:amidase signature enzyme [Laetiporus sulphureus 93-53]KZT05015.1 amidase signature enzyme [Laetiporus sulphureus 93-53]
MLKLTPRLTALSTLAVVLGVYLTVYGYGTLPPPLSWIFGAGSLPDLYEASMEELQEGLRKGRFTSVDLVKAYFARIDEVNLKGPALRAVIETNPSALKQAAELDEERKTSGPRGPLHGIPILLKDNIATLHEEGMNTTAGSYALLDSIVPGDATVSAKLRAAGAILLGKASLSEWANFRGLVPSGFCGRGGQCVSPYVPLGDPSGSSSGSGVAVAIGLAAGALGSETDGSIISPSNNNNIVGLKPTVGLTSRAGVIPISEHQDSVGPMCRTVADCAIILSAIAGRDPHDNYTLGQLATVPDYTKSLRRDGLKGARLGVPRKVLEGADANILIAFNEALEVLRTLGAKVVDPADFEGEGEHGWNAEKEDVVLCGDLKVNVNSYLSKLVEVPTGTRTLADLIEFNKTHADKELVEPFWNDQSRFIKSESTPQDVAYFDALAHGYRMGRELGIDGVLKRYDVDAIVMPASEASQPAAVAGYPIISVSLGFQPPDVPLGEAAPTRMNGPGMPFGIAFLGTAYSEETLFKYAYAYEQATKHRLRRRAYEEAVPKAQLKDVMKH